LLEQVYRQLNPVALKAEITSRLDALWNLADCCIGWVTVILRQRPLVR
jgi:hypothetical protein